MLASLRCWFPDAVVLNNAVELRRILVAWHRLALGQARDKVIVPVTVCGVGTLCLRRVTLTRYVRALVVAIRHIAMPFAATRITHICSVKVPAWHMPTQGCARVAHDMPFARIPRAKVVGSILRTDRRWHRASLAAFKRWLGQVGRSFARIGFIFAVDVIAVGEWGVSLRGIVLVAMALSCCRCWNHREPALFQLFNPVAVMPGAVTKRGDVGTVNFFIRLRVTDTPVPLAVVFLTAVCFQLKPSARHRCVRLEAYACLLVPHTLIRGTRVASVVPMTWDV